jgi:hypothetical protein
MNVRIFGDGLDALIFSAALSELKINHSWYQTSDHIGGYFRGSLNCQSSPIDLGMVLLEPNDYGIRRTELSEFAGESGVVARRYLSEAYSFLQSKFGVLRPVEIFTLNEELSESPDYFISDHLDAFLDFPAFAESELRERTKWTIDNPMWHPREKRNNPDQFTSISLEEFIILSFGQTFYDRYFRSFMSNLLGEKKNCLSAYLHRKAWMPIYWPETILSLLDGAQPLDPLFSPVFARPQLGSVSRWVTSMLNKVSNNPRVTLFKCPSIDPEQFDFFSSPYDFPFIPKEKFLPNSKFKLQHQKDKVILRLVHFCTEDQKDAVFFLNNQHEKCFRYSTFADQDKNAGAVMFEYGEASNNIPELDLIKLARNLAVQRNIRLTCRGKVYNSLLPLNQDNFQLASEISREIPNKYSIYNGSATTINDHILRGTRAASGIESLIK